ncbi:putative immunity protein [Kitasatospora sp. NPDC094015]|uniref:putative immunity protein n=1 Tax=Kitasatospora sp. NPDC094015 TaxID=3155205 RepID=UPI0033165AC0
MDDVTITDEDRRLLGLWAAGCAERVLPLFEARAPEDGRPRAALDSLGAFTRTGKRTAQLRSAAWAALKAAGEADDPVATAAARAACYAAAAPYIHALATPHQARHVHAPAIHAALARELAAGGNLGAGDAELRWAVEQAPPAVRGILRQLPAPAPGRGRLEALRERLDGALRH